MPGISKKTPLPHWQKVMEKAGWETATDVAKAANLPIGTAHNAIYGRNLPKPETISKIATAARIDPGIILRDIYNYALKISSTGPGIRS